MGQQSAEIIVLIFGSYVALGILVAPFLIFRGAQRFDAAAADSTLGFRLVVLPGAVLLWPLLLRRFLKGNGSPPTENNAHRARSGPPPGDAGAGA